MTRPLEPRDDGAAPDADVDDLGLTDEPNDDDWEPKPGVGDVDAEELDRFWADAQIRAGINPTREITGTHTADILAPPAWSFGDDPEIADQQLQFVLDGVKRATASSVAEYDAADMPLPEEGEMSILLDGGGHPRALIRMTEVRVVPFADVGDDHVALEGDESLEAWRARYRALFRSEPDVAAFDERMPVVLEQFELLVPRPGARRVPAATE